MCDRQDDYANALLSSQNQQTILVMLTWLFASLIALCTVPRIIIRHTSKRFPDLPLTDDAIVVTAALCAVGSTLVTWTAADSGLGKRGCLLDSDDVDRIQTKIFVATILSVLAITIAKCSLLLFLYRLADTTIKRTGTIAIGCLLLLWTIAVIATTVFQCGMPRPWTIWTGQCISLVPFWFTATIVDIVLDAAMLLLSLYIAWPLNTGYRQKTSVSLLLSLRLLLIAASILRIIYLPRAFSRTSNPTYSYFPYAVILQTHTTLAAILSCTLIFPSLRSLLVPSPSTTYAPISGSKKPRHTKGISGSTIGTVPGTPYNSHTSFHPPPYTQSEIAKEPLPSIQASMSTVNSPEPSGYISSPHNIDDAMLFQDVQLQTRTARPPPPRPQRPNAAQTLSCLNSPEPLRYTPSPSIMDDEKLLPDSLLQTRSARPPPRPQRPSEAHTLSCLKSPEPLRYTPSPSVMDDGKLLPDVLLPTRAARPPQRPPPPSEAQRPDLSLFTGAAGLKGSDSMGVGGMRGMSRGVGVETGRKGSLRNRGLA
ncbi:hypothetical protein NX059_009398 [Plenodomus lindquistii]|nr:hypothetical protein NX059_009398 [Plenodomus lindquistii]